MIQEICNWIVLISAVILAFTNIYKFFKKPVDAVQKRQEEQFDKKIDQYLQEAVPRILEKRADAVRAERAEEYEGLLKRVDAILIDRTSENFKDIKETISTQANEIGILKRTTLDLLRKNILEIYYGNKTSRTITETDREYLDDLFNDYTIEGGNSYIKRKYNRMIKWDVIPDEEEDDED